MPRSFLVYLIVCWQTVIFGGGGVVSAQQCAPEEHQQTMLLGIKPPAKYLGHRFPVQTPQECYDVCCSWDHGPDDRCNAAVFLAVDSDCLVLQCEPFENCAWGNAALAGTTGATVARIWRRVAHFWSSPGDDAPFPNVLAPPDQLSTLAANSSSPDPVVPSPAENPDGPVENVLLNPPTERTPAFDGQTLAEDSDGIDNGNENDRITPVDEPAVGVLEKPLPATEDENEQFAEGGVLWNEGGKDDGWKLFGSVADFEAAEKEESENEDLEKDEVDVDGETNGLQGSVENANPWNDIGKGQQTEADASPSEMPVTVVTFDGANNVVVRPETDGWNEENETPSPKNDEDAWNLVPDAAAVTELPIAEQIQLENDGGENQDAAIETNYDEWNDGEKALLVVEDENLGPSTVNDPDPVPENPVEQQNLETPAWMDNGVWSPVTVLPSSVGVANDGDWNNPNNVEDFMINVAGLKTVPINEYDPRWSEIEGRVSSPSEALASEMENSGLEWNSPMVMLIFLSVLSLGVILMLFIYRQYFIGRSLGPRYTPLRETKVEPPSSSSYLVSSPRYLD